MIYPKYLRSALLGASLLACLSCGAPKQAMPGKYAKLDVPRMTQDVNLCLPTSASMVLAYYGENKSQYSLKSLTGKEELLSSTTFRDMIVAVKKLGYDWKADWFTCDSDGFEQGFATLKAALDAECPPILGIYIHFNNSPGMYKPGIGEPITLGRQYMGHAVVLIGYDEEEKEVLFRDPTGYIKFCPYDELRDIWKTSDARARMVLYTVPKPKG